MTYVSKVHPMRATIAAALMLATFQAQAQQGVPNAGSILQQVPPVTPPTPPQRAPSLQVTPQAGSGLPASEPFQVDTIRIIGNAVFPTSTLHALVADSEGQRLTLPQLEVMAARITAYYQSHGFPLSRAVIPAQTIGTGSVTIQVLEARYGAVRLQNGSQVGSPLLDATAANLQQGAAIADRGLDRTLLLLSDIPGVGVNALLKPGAEVGTSDLDLVVSHNPTSIANLALDNAGNSYIGRGRASASVYVYNPLHHGDILSATVLSTGDRMNYGRVGYDLLVHGAGTRVGASYSALRYKLGEEARELGANGTAGVASAWVKHPLIRARQASLYAQLEFDRKHLRDHVDLTGIRTDRDLDNWVLSLNGDLRDDFLGGGISSASVAWTAGDVGFKDASARLLDASTTRTQGRYAKWNANFSRIQALGSNGTTLAASVAGQWSDANLDSAEKMSVGGPYMVRAYDVGALSGDTGYFTSVELRRDLGTFAAGRWKASAFIESARVRLNRETWSLVTDNQARLSGAGVELAWEGPDLWRASLSVAAPIGAESPLVAPQSSARAWFLLSTAF